MADSSKLVLRHTGFALVVLAAGCATTRPPPQAIPSPSEPALETAARQRGVDEEKVVEAQEEVVERVEDLPGPTRRQFLALFGGDPLGLMREPGNASRYVIPLETNDQVERWIRYYSKEIPERFALYLQRMGRYEDMILGKLDGARMPHDLIYLALIESGMNPDAYSHAHAVGMWQFIRSTGRSYGLDVSYWVDERRDPVLATDAAIAHLEDLYERFGSWYLAAAAYNGGAGRVRRGIRRTGSDSFWDLADARVLRRETRYYVPKLVAAAIIGHDPEKYGFDDVEKDPPVVFDLVAVPDATSLDVIAEAAGVDENEIERLNPQFRRNVTPPGHSVQVRVPRGTGETFTTAYAKIPPSERVTWLVHTVTRGQTLSGIASRYGSSVSAIRAANEGVHPRRLQIGQRLVVPREGRGAGGALASGGRPEGPAIVTVRHGDTLWAIARQHGVTTGQLMAWNGLSSSVIRPGDRLTIQR